MLLSCTVEGKLAGTFVSSSVCSASALHEAMDGAFPATRTYTPVKFYYCRPRPESYYFTIVFFSLALSLLSLFVWFVFHRCLYDK